MTAVRVAMPEEAKRTALPLMFRRRSSVPWVGIATTKRFAGVEGADSPAILDLWVGVVRLGSPSICEVIADNADDCPPVLPGDYLDASPLNVISLFRRDGESNIVLKLSRV